MWIEDVFSYMKAEPPAKRIEDQTAVKRLYRHWRIRMMYATFIGYAMFYICRKNISIALPAIGSDLGYTNAELGLFGSLLYITYGRCQSDRP